VPGDGDRGTTYCVKHYLGHYDHYGSRGLECGRAHPMDPKGFGNAIVITTPHPPKRQKGILRHTLYSIIHLIMVRMKTITI
jgi:hypothetical protein